MHSVFRVYYVIIAFLQVLTLETNAQDLDPRAYIWIPRNTRTAVAGFSYSYGGVMLDPTLPIQDLNADVQTVVLSYVHSFSFLGLTSQALVATPYSWAQLSGKVLGQQESATRSGFGDMRARITVLLAGAPAASLEQIKQAPRKTILGFSMNIIAPTGQFFSDKLINLGTNRFSFRPELALTQPIGRRGLIDIYSGVWFFTNNTEFYPGNAVRTQEPMGTFQAHFSYNINPRFWVALNTTYYVGGTSSINDLYNDDRQSNARVGITSVFPVGKYNSLKLAASTGAVVRVGQDFTTISIGWARSWFGKEPTGKASKQE